MSFIARLQRAREILAQQGRLSTRALARELGFGGQELDELIEELVDVQQVARREGRILVWVGAAAARADAGALRRPAGAAEARKVVTVVFADLVGSTALHERVDAESARRLMDRYYRTLRAAVESHAGTVVKLLGDGVMAAFGVPQVAEDDALRGVRAGVAMQHAFRALVREQGVLAEIGLRVAVNTGEVVVSGVNDDVVGDPVNVAARLQEQGRDGDVVIGEATRRLVAALVTLEPLGSVTLKGRAETVTAYRVVSLERPAGAAAAPFVGRDEELARLAAVYEVAVSTPAARLAVLLGAPGLGKSRLIDEFLQRRGEAVSVLTAHCNAAGGATFAPVAAALREFFVVEDGAPQEAPLDDTHVARPVQERAAHSLRAALEAALPAAPADRARIVDGISALLGGSPASPEETFFVIRRLLTGLAAAKPVVLVVDDLQWGEPLLLDLVEHLVQWGSGVPLLVLVGARPELRDLRSSLVTAGGYVADVVTLGGLDAGAAMRLAANVVGAADLPAAVAAKVLATSEGNPLFVGELVRMLVQEGALTKEGERWTTGAGLATLEMPPTIHALLAARIERLRPEQRSVLERAAVVGRHFSRGAVAALLGRDAGQLDARLEALRRSELIERDTGWFLGEPVLRFHHVLIRDAAYRRLLKGTRAELHERLADWIEAQVQDAAEHDETIGWHLEQAHQHLHELGPLDRKGRTLGERAAHRLSAAGRRALARDDVPLAASLLGRAIDRLDADDPARADLALDWCEALLSAGDVVPAAKAIDELARFLGPTASDQRPATSDRLSAWRTCFAAQLTVLTAPQGLQGAAAAVAAAAAQLATLEDAAGEAKAHSVHAQALARLGKMGASEAALDKALAAARKAGDRRRANAVLAGAPLAALWGPSPVTRASGRCLDVVRVLRITQGAPAVEAVALSCQGVLEALRGRTDAARRMIASARRMVEELGIAHRLFEADVFSGRIDLLEGDAGAAERNLRGAYDGLRELGLGIDAARAGALLARAQLAQGKVAEAEISSQESEALAGDDLQAAIAWRGVRAEALARRGEHAAALELAKAGVEIAAATDALLDHADARLALAAALRAAGRHAEADSEEGRAIDLWQAKGATLLAERVRQERRTSTSSAGASIPPPLRTRAAANATHRAVSANAATATIAAVDAAFVRMDLEAVAGLASPAYEEVDHWTGATWDREAWLTSCRRLMRSRDLQFRNLPLASLGESLMLSRRVLSGSAARGNRFDVGAYESEAICLIETDERGLVLREEIFASDHLGDAIARLYARYAELLPAGLQRERAAATAGSIAAMVAPPDIGRYASALAPDVDFADHRTVGFASGRGAGTLLRGFASLLELAENVATRVDEVLALQPGAVLLRWTTSGTDRASGGAFESSFLLLWKFGADGRVVRDETFDADRVAEALARFDELVGDPAAELAPPITPAASPFANAATRLNDRLSRAWIARDWDTIAAIRAPAHHLEDRRRLMQMRRPAEAAMAQVRVLFDVPASRWIITPIATRGERLALSRYLFEGQADDAGGALAIDYLAVDELDGAGRFHDIVLFDPDDCDAAYAELDARYAAGEGGLHAAAVAWIRDFGAALQRRDWDAVAACCAPAFVADDHRLVSWETLHGPAAFREALRAIVELAPDVRMRTDHLRTSYGAAIADNMRVGTRDGGTFESPFIYVLELDATGRALRLDFYDPHHLEQAQARFDAIGASPPADSLPALAKPTTATAAMERSWAAFDAGDWDAVRAACAAEFTWEDRRPLFRLSGNVELMIASARERKAAGARHERRSIVGTAGDRVAVASVLWAGGPADGRFEVEFLALHESDEAGLGIASIFFDPGDARDAQREAWARWAAIDPAAAAVTAAIGEQVDAFNAHDPVRYRAVFADDLVVEDHRRTGMGRIDGADAYVDSLVALWELAPASQVAAGWFWPACDRHGAITDMRRTGTVPDGGDFESDYLHLCTIARGRVTRVELFEVEDLDAALARFEALRPDPLRVPPNAVTRLWDRWYEAGTAGDWDAIRAMYDPSYRAEDRRRLFRMTLDLDRVNVNDRYLFAGGWRATRTLLATAGERLALHHIVWRMGEARASSEIEVLELDEVDRDGRFASVVVFDPDDRAAAQAELFERYVAAGGEGMPRGLIEYARALNAHDLGRARTGLCDDFVLEDHRRTGMGRLDGGDAYIAAVAAAYELTRALSVHVLYAAAIAPRGRVLLVRAAGLNAEGGKFETVYVALARFRGERIAAFEFFEPEDLDLALGRFDALGAAPVQ